MQVNRQLHTYSHKYILYFLFCQAKSNVVVAEVALKSLEVVRDIIPIVGTSCTKKILTAVSPLLVSVELDMRLCICDLLDALAKADASVLFVVMLASYLSAISTLVKHI